MHNYFFILLLIAFSSFSQEKKQLFENKQLKLKAEYHTLDGFLNGKYVSYYANGKKKAEGDFKNNLRVGKWNVWDSTGKVHAEHIFKPEKRERNAHDFFDYTLLNEKDVLIEKTVWREIHREENPLLFSDASFFDLLFDLILTDSLIVYADDDFTKPRTKENIQDMVGSNYYIIDSYREKEDWFFDKKTNEALIRPIGLFITLVPRNPESDGKIELGWMHFPHLRKILANQKINDKPYPYLKNIDDIFWYRHFVSQIYKEVNVYDRPFSVYAKTPEAMAYEAERAEIDMIEMEHDAWLFGDKALEHW